MQYSMNKIKICIDLIIINPTQAEIEEILNDYNVIYEIF